MYALFIEVELPEEPTADDIAAAGLGLQEGAARTAQVGGATHGFWISPIGRRGISMVIFEDEATARAMVEQLPKVGERGPFATFKTIEVREVLASV